MQKRLQKTAALLRAAAPWALGAALALWAAAVLLAGGTLPGLALYLVLFALALPGAGLLLARCLLPGAGTAEQLACAFPLGCVLLFAAWAALCATPLRGVAAPASVLLCALAGACGARCALPELRAAARHAPPALLWAMALFLLLHTLYGPLPAALPARLRVWTYNQDLLWSIGNAAGVQYGLPFQDMRAAGLPLYYHFLNDAAAGLLARAAGVTAWAGLAFYWYAPVGLLCVLALWALARRLGCTPGVAVLAAAGVLCAGDGGSLAFQMYSNINGMGGALLCLCAVLLAAAHLPRAARDSRAAAARALAGLALCCLALSLYKSTLGMLAACALLAAAAVTALQRRAAREKLWALAAGLAALAAFGLCWAAIYRHAVNNLVFTGTERLPGLPAAVMHTAALGAAAFLLALPYNLRRLPRLDLAELSVNALAVGGPLAYGLYTHYSASQTYFLLAAVPMWWLSALPALPACARRLGGLWQKRARAAAAALCALAFAAGLYTMRGPCRTGVQAALRCLGLRTSPVTEQSILAGEGQAAAWLRENTPPDSVFSSNRNDRFPSAGEGTFHYFTAAAERRCYVESYRYAFDYTNQYHEIRRRLEQVSDAIYRDLPEDEAFALAAAEGIDYIVVSYQGVNIPHWQRQPVFQNGAAAIWAVNAG